MESLYLLFTLSHSLSTEVYIAVTNPKGSRENRHCTTAFFCAKAVEMAFYQKPYSLPLFLLERSHVSSVLDLTNVQLGGERRHTYKPKAIGLVPPIVCWPLVLRRSYKFARGLFLYGSVVCSVVIACFNSDQLSGTNSIVYSRFPLVFSSSSCL